MEFPPQIGGISTYVHDLAAALERGRVIVLAPPKRESDLWDKWQIYKTIRKPFLYPVFIWPRWLRLFFEVRRIVKQEKIELLMIHHVLPVGYVGLLIKKLFGIPFLLFSHGTDLVAGTETRWKRAMVMMVSRASEQIIFNSESLKARFLRVLPAFENKSLVMYPCPEREFMIEPKAEDVETLRDTYALHGKQVILTVSRLTEGKGFPHLIRMMPEILKKNPNLVWMIIGDGEKREEIIEQIQENYLQNIVRYVGEVPHHQLRAFYHLADLFVLLTHPDEGKEEGLGLVFLEAAAAGVPVVAGRSGGVEEAVLNGKTGVVVDLFHGHEAIVDTVASLLADQKTRTLFGENAQQRIGKEFIWDVQLGKLSQWINQ